MALAEFGLLPIYSSLVFEGHCHINLFFRYRRKFPQRVVRPSFDFLTLSRRLWEGHGSPAAPQKSIGLDERPELLANNMRRLCPPAAATSSARFAVSCPLMSFKSGIASSPGSGVGPAQGLKPLEVIDELKQVRGREDRHVGCSPRGFGAVRSWTDQALAERVGPDRGRKRAGDGRYRPVERKLSEHAIALDCIARDRANRGHQAKRDGKVVRS